MVLLSLLSTAALTLTANAVLVPLDIANKATATSALSHKPLSDGQAVALNCANCPFAAAVKGAKDGYVWKTHGPQTDLVMDFTTDRKTLFLNGAPFYPTWPNAGLPRTKQIIKPFEDVKNLEPFKGDFGLSYSLEFDAPPKKTFLADKGKVSHVTITINVLGLDGHMINTDAIYVHVVKTADDELLFQSISTGPSLSANYAKNCTSILCRVRAILFAKIQAIREAATKTAHRIKAGCMRKFGIRPHPKHANATKAHGGSDRVAPKHSSPHASRPHDSKPAHHEVRPLHAEAPKHDEQPHRGHPGQHHRPGMRKFVCSLKRAFKHVILPILIGVAAGMAASVVGILVGQVVVFFWMRYRRSSGAVYLPAGQVEDGEKAEEEGLPKYEDAMVGEGMREVEVETDEKKELLG